MIMEGGGDILGSDVPLQLVVVKITKRCRNMIEVAKQASQTHYHSVAGEILPHLYVKNIFLAQKLTKWHLFKEIYAQNIRKFDGKKTLIFHNFFLCLYYVYYHQIWRNN